MRFILPSMDHVPGDCTSAEIHLISETTSRDIGAGAKHTDNVDILYPLGEHISLIKMEAFGYSQGERPSTLVAEYLET